MPLYQNISDTTRYKVHGPATKHPPGVHQGCGSTNQHLFPRREGHGHTPAHTFCSNSLSWSSTLGKPSISTLVCWASLRASFSRPAGRRRGRATGW